MLELNKVYNMDCLEGLKELQDNSVDLVITDPPYKVSQNYGGGVDADNLKNVANILRSFPEICRVLKKGRFFISFYDNRILPFLFEAIKGTDLVYRKSIYLYRRWGNAHRWMGWMQCTDPVCFFVKGHDKSFMPKGIKSKVKHDCYIKSSPEQESTGHPAQKPLEIIRDIIIWCSKEKELILDPYVGSGSVPVVCKQTNRDFIAFDNNKDYVDIANKRLNQNTLTQTPTQ
ncbi:hypothetical protein LCGC14_0515200 [marine sediment metagenome]|uniref:DNA methylase N-4/N-6 domain-containing protein n=1 Tax=marine sediment metagenome TaxID=412755 RepID=A0A0F9S4Z1_9ZZZZ